MRASKALTRALASSTNSALSGDSQLGLPGYLKNEELYDGISSELTADDIARCKSQLQSEPIKWLKATNNPKSIFVVVMERVFSE